MKNLWWKQRLRVELESDDPLSAKSIRISGKNQTPDNVLIL